MAVELCNSGDFADYLIGNCNFLIKIFKKNLGNYLF